MNLDRLRNKLKDIGSTWEKNVGRVDARIRILIGSLLMTLAPLQAAGFLPIPFFTSAGAFTAGAILMIEGALNRCILYSLLGIDRCPTDIKSGSKN